MNEATALMNGLIAIGAGIAIFGGGLGAGIGQGLAVKGAMSAMARNPERHSKLQTTMLIGLGIIESAPIYGFAIAIILISNMG